MLSLAIWILIAVVGLVLYIAPAFMYRRMYQPEGFADTNDIQKGILDIENLQNLLKDPTSTPDVGVIEMSQPAPATDDAAMPMPPQGSALDQGSLFSSMIPKAAQSKYEEDHEDEYLETDIEEDGHKPGPVPNSPFTAQHPGSNIPAFPVGGFQPTMMFPSCPKCPTCPERAPCPKQKPCPKCPPVPDMKRYIEKDSIPCWGCKLPTNN